MMQLVQLVTGIAILFGLLLAVIHVISGGALTSLFMWLDTWLIWLILAAAGLIGLIRFIAKN